MNLIKLIIAFVRLIDAIIFIIKNSLRTLLLKILIIKML